MMVPAAPHRCRSAQTAGWRRLDGEWRQQDGGRQQQESLGSCADRYKVRAAKEHMQHDIASN